MLDALTNFGEINLATAQSGGQTVKSDVIVMIDEDEARDSISAVAGHTVNAPLNGKIRAEKGPYDLRVAVYPKTAATQDITISILEGNTLSGNDIASPATVTSMTVAAADVKVGVPIKIGFPLSYKKYWQLAVTSTGTVKVFAGLEFGA